MYREVSLQKAVEAFGGFSALARKLDLTLSTVHGWARRDSLPVWRAKEIIAVARKHKIKLKDIYRDLPSKKKRKRSS